MCNYRSAVFVDMQFNFSWTLMVISQESSRVPQYLQSYNWFQYFLHMQSDAVLLHIF